MIHYFDNWISLDHIITTTIIYNFFTCFSSIEFKKAQKFTGVLQIFASVHPKQSPSMNPQSQIDKSWCGLFLEVIDSADIPKDEITTDHINFLRGDSKVAAKILVMHELAELLKVKHENQRAKATFEKKKHMVSNLLDFLSHY